MKQLLIILFTFAVLSGQSQKNVFLDQAFWKSNPDVATITAEIEKGSNPSELNGMSMDGVVLAINNRASTESIKYMLSQKGNDVNKLTHDGRTYIFWAANSGNAGLVEYLLQQGSKLDLEDSHGATVLTFIAAAGQKNTAVYDLCMKYGADLKKVVNQDGANVLLLAIAQDKDFTLTNYFISKGLDLKSTDNAGNTAFNYATRSGNVDLLKSLVQKGVKYNDNAMLMASQGGGRGSSGATIEVFRYMDELKIKPAVTNDNGENPLHFIVRRPNQIPVISYFLSKGVNTNQADNDGNTPFMNAAYFNRDTATIGLLLPSLNNINQVNKKGVSALAMAMNNNSAAMVRYLIEKGADINTRDAKGNNLAYYLMQSYNPMRGMEDFEGKITLLVEKGFDLAAPQQNGNTLYHLAIAKNDLDLLKRLESLKINVNSKNKEGLTVLHKAAMTAKNDAILKYLLSIGARKDIMTDFKETVFDLASENEYLAKNKTTIDFLK